MIDVLAPEPEVHRRLLGLGFEGSVLKRRGARYVPGRRSRAWHKMKARSHSTAVLEVVAADRTSGVVERVGCRVADDPERLTWAVVWGRGLRRELTGDPIGSLDRAPEVAYTSRFPSTGCGRSTTGPRSAASTICQTRTRVLSELEQYLEPARDEGR